ncbi:SLIT1 [Branchiostoma lanceolatum]|uniref:SLIT1 protein n=1 Tax=Branchiostoma lanceolatum TaxID=7740 RepID=A0A8J9ZA92_BRALA|nr:SLIT1 [Branchiostoma lanceolatum]
MKGLGLVLILSSLAVYSSSSQNATDCPPCTCTLDVGGTDVDCSGRGLTELPTNLPNDTVYLAFKYNNLTTLNLDELCKLRLLKFFSLLQIP